MSFLYGDSFDHYSTAHLTRKWSGRYGGGAGDSVSPGGGRNGTQGYHINPRSAAGGLWKTFAPRSSWVVGVAYRPDGSFVGGVDTRLKIFTFVDGPNGSPQCDLSLLPDMTLAITRNGALLAGGVSTQALVMGTYYYIEMRVTIDSSVPANSCSVNVNGPEWLSVSPGQSTRVTPNTTANMVSLGRAQIASAESATGDFDDFYVCDNAGSANNTFLGDVMIQPYYPAGAGATTQWTPSAGANWQNVSEHSPDDDASYNKTGVPSKVDLYALDQMAGTAPTIFGVQWNAQVRKNDASNYVLNRALRSGTTTFFGPTAITPNATYVNYTEALEVDPNTGLAWTKTTFNAMQAGLKLVSAV